MIRKLLCLFGHHDWTSRHKEGVPPDPSRLVEPGYFFEWAQPYCRHCSKRIGSMT